MLNPGAVEKHHCGHQDDDVGDQHAGNPPAAAEQPHDGFHPDMAMVLEGQHRADEGEPDKEIAAHFLREIQSAVKAVPEHDVGRDHDDHAQQEPGQNELDHFDDDADGPSHERVSPPMPKIAHCACSGLLP